MDSVEYQTFRAAVCDADGCWQREPMTEAGVSADDGAGWIYFRMERHFCSIECVGRAGMVAEMCDGLAVPLQLSRRKLIFLELKTAGKYADAIDQIRAGVEEILAFGIPGNVALTAEIWYRREPKSPITTSRVVSIGGRDVLVRHRRSSAG
jgi:hypothetical protein